MTSYLDPGVTERLHDCHSRVRILVQQLEKQVLSFIRYMTPDVALHLQTTHNTCNITQLFVGHSGSHHTLSGEITQLSGDITKLSGDITQLSGDITHSGDITQLAVDITQLPHDITQLSVHITQSPGDITTIRSDYAAVALYMYTQHNLAAT